MYIYKYTYIHTYIHTYIYIYIYIYIYTAWIWVYIVKKHAYIYIYVMAFGFSMLMAYQPSWIIWCQSHPGRRSVVVLFMVKVCVCICLCSLYIFIYIYSITNAPNRCSITIYVRLPWIESPNQSIADKVSSAVTCCYAAMVRTIFTTQAALHSIHKDVLPIFQGKQFNL